MIKKGIKIIGIILICFLTINILGINNTKVFAEEMHDVTENVDYWEPKSKGEASDFKEKINIIVTMVRTIGIIISVITLSVIGIKFMLGSVEEKSQYKQTLAPWIIGAILVFAITTIPTLIYDLTINETEGGKGGGGLRPPGRVDLFY